MKSLLYEMLPSFKGHPITAQNIRKRQDGFVRGQRENVTGDELNILATDLNS